MEAVESRRKKKKKAVLFQNKARHNIKWLKDVRVEDTKK